LFHKIRRYENEKARIVRALQIGLVTVSDFLTDSFFLHCLEYPSSDKIAQGLAFLRCFHAQGSVLRRFDHERDTFGFTKFLGPAHVSTVSCKGMTVFEGLGSQSGCWYPE
jgi:hypothetical protein